MILLHCAWIVCITALPLSSVYGAGAEDPANTPATAESPAPDDPVDDQTAEEMLAAEAALEAAQAQAGNTDATDATDLPPDTATPANDNEDFVPSIQISEDLSVSFPVDI